MARLIPSAERITRARGLIQKAREVPLPPGVGRYDLAFVAEVKGLLRQARDLIKFIPYTPSATVEMKDEVTKLFEEADHAEKEILHQ